MQQQKKTELVITVQLSSILKNWLSLGSLSKYPKKIVIWSKDHCLRSIDIIVLIKLRIYKAYLCFIIVSHIISEIARTIQSWKIQRFS